MINEFQDGIAIVKSNKKISYHNNPVNELFGMSNDDVKDEINQWDKDKFINVKSFKSHITYEKKNLSISQKS